MNRSKATSGMIFEEPLVFDRGSPGRCGVELPETGTSLVDNDPLIPDNLARKSLDGMPELTEVEVVQHFTHLSQMNYGVDSGAYPLGSCTMKYNPKVNELVAGLNGYAQAHPMAPAETLQPLLKLMKQLENYLAEITGMGATSLMPSAGAQGELTALLVIAAYLRKTSSTKRTTVLIPDTAHGTNPASCTLAGMDVRQVKSSRDGILTAEALKKELTPDVAALMLTNPNTLGLFETHMAELAELLHDNGSLLYVDGANMNALMGVARPGDLGADALQLNLHKTFSTPHGGGGPGAGPICVKSFLEPFLPAPRIVGDEGNYRLDGNPEDSIGMMRSFFGNFGVLLKAYSYILTMGSEGLKRATQVAVLNANYLRKRLEDHLTLPYKGKCMHECVFSDEGLKSTGVTTMDIAKRLMDYGIHPPTIYFPLVVSGALMVEPTETLNAEEIDGLADAFKEIVRDAKERPEIVKGAPNITFRGRVDEVQAARKPKLKWEPAGSDNK